MTAIVAIVQPSAVHLLTDGAVCDRDGMLFGTLNKVQHCPQLHLAFAWRGAPAFGMHLALRLSSMVASFDDFTARAGEVCHSVWKEAQHDLHVAAFGPDFELIVAGWTAADSSNAKHVSLLPRAWALSSHGAEPFRPIEIDGVAAAPFDEPMRIDFSKRFPPGTDPTTLNSDRDGLAILEIQRRYPTSFGHGAVFHGIGAFAQLTTITADAITTRVIHRWPDEVGKRLTP